MLGGHTLRSPSTPFARAVGPLPLWLQGGSGGRDDEECSRAHTVSSALLEVDQLILSEGEVVLGADGVGTRLLVRLNQTPLVHGQTHVVLVHLHLCVADDDGGSCL